MNYEYDEKKIDTFWIIGTIIGSKLYFTNYKYNVY